MLQCHTQNSMDQNRLARQPFQPFRIAGKDSHSEALLRIAHALEYIPAQLPLFITPGGLVSPWYREVIIVATVSTLVVVPALCALWFEVGRRTCVRLMRGACGRGPT
jgi:hypothetical protein